MRIYVGNLSYETTDASLAAAFEAHGAVKSAAVVRDRESGQPRGFGFVEMGDNKEAARAISALDRTQIDGKAVNVSVAREPNSQGAGRDRRSR
ncbi:MAG TPA: RNA-binding protein [Tepidiformaceae bacterium]|nr:RNA-binding protein [Tepidiformaceae bacterium]